MIVDIKGMGYTDKLRRGCDKECIPQYVAKGLSEADSPGREPTAVSPNERAALSCS